MTCEDAREGARPTLGRFCVDAADPRFFSDATPFDIEAEARLVRSCVGGCSLERPLAMVGGARLHLFGAAARQAVVADSDGRAALSRCVASIGAFDGVHLGHRELLVACVSEARARGVAAVAVTFDPDPARVLRPEGLSPRLSRLEDRVRLISSLGLDALCVIPFTPAIAELGYEQFVRSWLLPALHPEAIHVGSDFKLGAGGLGTVEALAGLGRELGYTVRGHELLALDGSPVTSTRIRSLVSVGDVHGARTLLGRPHFVSGEVRHGRGEGTAFGFPTANVACDPEVALPADGVYACLVACGDRAWPAAVNVGAPRSFGERGRAAATSAYLEANLLGFSGDLYGSEVSVLFLDWLRAPRAFSDTEDLERVVLGNIAWVRERLGSHVVEVAK